MTFSIAARCAETGQFAVAVASSSPAVAARCAYARAGVGAATTQNITDPRLGPRALALLAEGMTAAEACKTLQAEATHLDYRQLTLVDDKGGTAHFSGSRSLGLHAAASGRNVVSAGNLLASTGVPAAIVAAFEAAPADHLGDRVLAAMRAGLAAGGEAGPIRSIGLILVDRVAWPVVDLRVDWHNHPLDALDALWAVWRPQMQDYVTRALNPESAPSFGVPGNE
ncbi:DUF1028 domain-containing protein [Acidiphilium sp. AL]|uniref:DUF1028 domain-containing protein n=1 Tax=Acidiphilium iwatense TaxID=768198 RepID=A0ABS9E3X5_9PROT|nr:MULTISPECIES: DUF1028 domain-containing protein [Acidiphilium]MCF3948715.1 DUF1028 domain-containing protein [Acidiphilium iwatense]MCU4160376.1 DUF1028 domain-containing protein [Acidiphilium sp. AL]